MPTIFDALPGLDVPVGAISNSVARMWAETAAAGRPAPGDDDAKATQVNFVLHLGFRTTPEDAVAQFQTVVRFSQRCPSRIVVLCPLDGAGGEMELRAKVYGECFLGKSKGDKRCVEFVMLSYPRAARTHLENQVSICLSTDLPLYYWAHRFSESSKLADYTYLLSRAKRVLIDSAISPPDALTYPWPNPASLRDLVYSRLLPVRRTMGQFLARYEPAVLAAGLRRVTISRGDGLAAEGHALRGWLCRRLADCGADAEKVAYIETAAAAGSLGVQFEYADPAKYFRWSGDLGTKHGCFEADLGPGKVSLSAAVSLLVPEAALSEAMFF
jgi:hypothetical protein